MSKQENNEDMITLIDENGNEQLRLILMIMANPISLSIQRNKKMTIPLTFKLTL